MSLRILSRLAFTAALALPLPAAAQLNPDPTAADLAQLCEADANATRDACGNFLAGLVDVYVMIGSKNETRRVACPPRTLTPDQMRNVFVAWAETRSDLAGISVQDAAAMAIKDRFPCSQIFVPRRKQ